MECQIQNVLFTPCSEEEGCIKKEAITFILNILTIVNCSKSDLGFHEDSVY